MASKSFINQDIEIVDSNSKVLLSKLLMWYGCDFGDNDDEILKKLSEFVTDGELKEKLDQIVKNKSSEPKIVFRDYNWTLNAK